MKHCVSVTKSLATKVLPARAETASKYQPPSDNPDIDNNYQKLVKAGLLG